MGSLYRLRQCLPRWLESKHEPIIPGTDESRNRDMIHQRDYVRVDAWMRRMRLALQNASLCSKYNTEATQRHGAKQHEILPTLSILPLLSPAWSVQREFVTKHGICIKLSHAHMRPGSNPGPPRATSRLFARAPGRVAYWISRGFPHTNSMCIPCGARQKL
jgi:hypothetical protein